MLCLNALDKEMLRIFHISAVYGYIRHSLKRTLVGLVERYFGHLLHFQFFILQLFHEGIIINSQIATYATPYVFPLKRFRKKL